jgi:hypothetical protein
VVNYDKTILPGGEGKISVKIDTSSYGQGDLKKTVKVYTNDTKNSLVTLTVKASIKVYINISPKSVILSGLEGNVISKSVTITGNGDKPLSLEPEIFSLEQKVTYQIETVEEGKIYKIHFKNAPEATGSINGVLILKTSYPEKPEISIPIRARFRKSVEQKDNSKD